MLEHLTRSALTRTGGLTLFGAVLLLSLQATQAQEAADCAQRYTFSWSLEECHFIPRGGTSEGAPVTLDPEPHSGWTSLQEDGLSDFERARPYHSWGTEYVYVVEERPRYISLQHILVMFMEGEDGEVAGPFVQKHWRQDWEYEKQNLLVYAGNRTWEKNSLDEETWQGTWTQSVYQVDDSPRYQSHGEWEHKDNLSTWLGSETWRPLPRRESSVRDDYQVLEARNRHTITPQGWVHEEDNYKLRLDEQGNPAAEEPYLAREIGVNRYDRIVDFDFSAGDRYWESTSSFWRDVREVWQAFIDDSQRVRIAEQHDGTPLFAALFGLAEDYGDGETVSPEQNRSRVRDILEAYISNR